MNDPKQQRAKSASIKSPLPVSEKHQIRPEQSIDLLKELHILTRDGKLNQDSKRKLKQVYHLYQFIQPLLQQLINAKLPLTLVDHGAGKSYLGFILYDLFFKQLTIPAHIYGIETRDELVSKSQLLAAKLNFANMSFFNLAVADATASEHLPENVSIVTALHACNTATDDAISFGLAKQAKHMVLVPCCQAEIAALFKKNAPKPQNNPALGEMWRHPLHGREFGSHLSNVLRCLQLEAHGYAVTVTELVGWEHSLKNELIIASYKNRPTEVARQRLTELLATLGISELLPRYLANHKSG